MDAAWKVQIGHAWWSEPAWLQLWQPEGPTEKRPPRRLLRLWVHHQPSLPCTGDGDSSTERDDDDRPPFDETSSSWKVQHTWPLHHCSIDDASAEDDTSLTLRVPSSQAMTLRFATAIEARDFVQGLHDWQQEQQDELVQFLRRHGGRTLAQPPWQVVGDILSATHLPPRADLGRLRNPYVRVEQSGREVHRTSIQPRTLEPLWTVATQSIFSLAWADLLFSTDSSVTLVLMDHTTVGRDRVVGQVTLSLDDLIQAAVHGQRHSLRLKVAIRSGTTPPQLQVRFQSVTSRDKKILNDLQQRPHATGIVASQVFAPAQRGRPATLNGRYIKRVQPYPDPARPVTTEWLTSYELDGEARKPSTRWTALRGRDPPVGRLHVELLSCDHLPNKDQWTWNLRDKTDAFGCFVLEDYMAHTDVIVDCLNPRWPCWSRRAFVFDVHHASSHLYMAVADHDPALAPGQLLPELSWKHNAIGRCVLALSWLQPATVYTLKLPLHFDRATEETEGSTSKEQSAFEPDVDTEENATVTLRIRLEWSNLRHALTNGAKPPSEYLVSCQQQTSFDLAHYAVHGVADPTVWSMGTFTGHIREVQEYRRDLVPKLRAAATALLLWHGHYPICLGPWRSIHLPLHSMTAFAWGLFVVQDLNRLVSLAIFAIGWILLASNEHSHHHPSPWHRGRSYRDLLQMLATGVSYPEQIQPHQNKDEIASFHQSMADQVLQSKVIQDFEAEQEREFQNQLNLEIRKADMDNVDITSQKRRGLRQKLPVKVPHPFKSTLHPIQLRLGQFVNLLRVAIRILTWNETFYAFWLVTLSFLVSALALLVPWAYLIRFLMKAVILLVSGPWTAVAFRSWEFFERRRAVRSNLNWQDEIRQRLKSQYEKVTKRAQRVQIQREKALQQQGWSRYLFGPWLFRIPSIPTHRVENIVRPLPVSFAEPWSKKKPQQTKTAQQFAGQSSWSFFSAGNDKILPVPPPSAAYGSGLSGDNKEALKEE